VDGCLPGHRGHDLALARNLVARKWDYASRRKPGRPSAGISVKTLIIRIARENPAWGHRRIQGELARLGHATAASTVWEILHAAGIDPAPRRADLAGVPGRPGAAIIACDFLVAETVLLKRLYVSVTWNPRSEGSAGRRPSSPARIST
jgi:hypothetical protein